MADFAFKFPGKKAAGPETKAMDMKPSEESADTTDDAEPTYSPEEMGKRLITAIRSGDGGAVFEAFVTAMEYQHKMDGSTAAHDKMKALEG